MRILKYSVTIMLCSTLLSTWFSMHGLHAQDTADTFKLEVAEDKAASEDQKITNINEETKKAQIVVTGTRTAKPYRNAPVKTEVLSKQKIEAKAANNLFEALSGESGIIADNQCQNCGLNTVRLNGLEGNYTQILINSVPAVSSLASTYLFQQIPVEMIDRVEVVKGGGSALYGSGAIGGIVNVITIKPVTNSASISYKQEFIDGYDDLAYTISGYASAVSQSGKSGIAVFGSRQDKDPYDRNGDGVSDLAAMQNTMFGTSLFFVPASGMDLSAQFFSIKEFRRGGDHISRPATGTFVTEQIESDINIGIMKFTHELSDSLNYEVDYNFSHMKRDTYYGGRSDLTDNDDLREALNEYGTSINPYHMAALIVHYRPLKQLTLTAGTEFMHDDLVDKAALTGVASVDETYTNFGGYIQADWDQDLFEVVAGLRLDKHSELDMVKLSPRVSGIVKLMDQLKFRAAWATGFKAPQVFDEDFHIEQSTAAGETKNRRIVNADDLKAETSHSFNGDASGDIKSGDFDFDYSAGLFFTMIKDKMEVDYENPSFEDATTKEFERANVNGTSKILGYNLGAGVSWSDMVRFSTGLTFIQFAELEDGTRMQEVPDIGAFTMLEFFYKALAVSLSNEIIGNQKIYNDNAGELVSTDRFAVFNARVAYRFTPANLPYLDLYAGVDNIGNAYQKDLDSLDVSGTAVSGERDAGYVYGPGKPRTFYVGMKAGF